MIQPDITINSVDLLKRRSFLKKQISELEYLESYAVFNGLPVSGTKIKKLDLIRSCLHLAGEPLSVNKLFLLLHEKHPSMFRNQKTMVHLINTSRDIAESYNIRNIKYGVYQYISN